MSSTTDVSSDLVPFSHSFVLKWTLKGQQLIDLEAGSNASVIRSDVYQFKFAKDLRFYLEIRKPGQYHWYNDWASIKGSKMWSFKLSYAFLISKERAYKLKASPQLSFIGTFYSSYVSGEEDVAVHSVVIACPVHPDPSAKEDEVILQKDQNTVGIEGIPNFSFPSNYTNEIAIDFIRRGDVPNFTADMAIILIGETEVHKSEVLKILCTEYLEENITARNFKEILQAALKHDLRRLERICMVKITSGNIQIQNS
ncbi:hypothetical protein AVEN_98354-1 [Araneus ventricosus]|uniref:Uncharacterized protein n=1 Tax=Araneus ventricosus TaxID=182803 RepID=A0A4Y2NCF8_ARAVE|nr:hypothetical protein AVEN_98354-1 [Araneus ventricosus]